MATSGRRERLSDGEKTEVKDLIHALYESSGERSWAAFARRAQVSEYSLRDWRTGDGTPSAINLIRMLQSAGWLERRAEGAAEPLSDSTARRLEELEATVGAQGRATTAALEALTRGIRKLERRIEAEGAPTKQGRASR